MRIAVAALLFTVACGPPSWPETSWPGADAPTADGPTRFSIEPADPIEGEEVLLVVPIAPRDGCYAWSATVRREDREGTVVLVAEPTSPDPCPAVLESGGGVLVELGPLAAGTYLVRAGELELTVEVRGAETSPEPPPLWWRVAHAVASHNGVGSACGERGPDAPPPRPWRLRAPRLHHQVAAAHPAWDADAIEAAMCIAQSVTVRAVSEREFRYRHDRSTLCHRAEAIGTVWVRGDGTLEVGAPYVIDGGDVDC